ncbi:MAG: DNA mismatch repair endonuclease MutL [Methanoregula sp.]|nr:DNA mismatch repair endonuclease MutL [Methanoregula sp.]
MSNGPLRSIRILDTATVNTIAAGEVVERPASVVKELVENAIDSGARSIRIGISSNGAIRSIRVTDDGSGMSQEDALLAFTPHATSKIAGIGDLDHIRTLGFRGEALASIAAVARVTMITKAGEGSATAGTKVVIEGGEVKEHSLTGAPAGTSILVEDLFFNTPARKKFQKSKNTELARIHAIMEGICLANPEISFRLFHNSAEQLVTDRTPDILDTIARIYGSDAARELVPVSASLPFMALSGYISQPSRARKDTTRMLVAINQRYISSPLINNAVKEGYGTLLSRDRYPVTFLRLEIDTGLVDVNVHPTKKHVRLTREKEIGDAVREAVRRALFSHDLIPSAGSKAACDGGGSRPLEVPETGSPAMDLDIPGKAYSCAEPVPAGVSEPSHAGVTTTDRQLRQTEPATGLHTVNSPVPLMDVVGQFGGIYILATTRTGELMIIDQHAAHERILYEIVKGRSQAERSSQELIVPVLLQKTAREAAQLRELMPSLEKEGLVLEEFGHDSFLVRSIPAILGKLDETSTIREFVSDLAAADCIRGTDDRERIIRIIACRGAIKAGTVCTTEQAQRLINQLRLVENPFTCPHGRPTMIRYTRAELDGMFKRTGF